MTYIKKAGEPFFYLNKKYIESVYIAKPVFFIFSITELYELSGDVVQIKKALKQKKNVSLNFI